MNNEERREASYRLRENPSSLTIEQCFDQFRPMAFKVARRYPESATLTHSELATELLMHVWLVWSKYDPEKGAVSSWVIRVMRSQATRVVKNQEWQRSAKTIIDPGAERDGDEWEKRRVHSLDAMNGMLDGVQWEPEAVEEYTLEDRVALWSLTLVERFTYLAYKAGYRLKEIASLLASATKMPAAYLGIEWDMDAVLLVLESAAQKMVD